MWTHTFPCAYKQSHVQTITSSVCSETYTYTNCKCIRTCICDCGYKHIIYGISRNVCMHVCVYIRLYMGTYQHTHTHARQHTHTYNIQGNTCKHRQAADHNLGMRVCVCVYLSDGRV